MDIDMSPFRDTRENGQPSKLYLGTEAGLAARKKLKLNRLDRREGVVTFQFPMDIWSINTSFFLGAFGDSVRKLGKEKFKEKYHFVVPRDIQDDIDWNIDQALKYL
jgi:hypothetical protein